MPLFCHGATVMCVKTKILFLNVHEEGNELFGRKICVTHIKRNSSTWMGHGLNDSRSQKTPKKTKSTYNMHTKKWQQ